MNVDQNALTVVNVLRKEANAQPLEKLRHGVRNDGKFCPLTNSLRPCGVTAVSQSCVEFDDGTARRPTQAFVEFIRWFDAGWFQEYVI